MACCCCAASSSHGLSRLLLLLATTTSSRRCRSGSPRIGGFILPSALSPNLKRRIYSRTRTRASPEPPPPLDIAADWSAGEGEEEDRDERIGFEIQVSKMGKRNRRLVRARVRVDAPLEAVWATLTDYEGLADFIPGLSECRLLDQADGFARLYQVGEQDLALGFKFNAKGTIDCYEGDLESLPAAGMRARRREIAFNMIQGDFKVFQGKWSVEEVDASSCSVVESGQDSEVPVQEEFQTTLSYMVELEPKLWVPVRLLEGRICSEIKNNLVSIREQAERIHRLP